MSNKTVHNRANHYRLHRLCKILKIFKWSRNSKNQRLNRFSPSEVDSFSTVQLRSHIIDDKCRKVNFQSVYKWRENKMNIELARTRFFWNTGPVSKTIGRRILYQDQVTTITYPVVRRWTIVEFSQILETAPRWNILLRTNFCFLSLCHYWYYKIISGSTVVPGNDKNK